MAAGAAKRTATAGAVRATAARGFHRGGCPAGSRIGHRPLARASTARTGAMLDPKPILLAGLLTAAAGSVALSGGP